MLGLWVDPLGILAEGASCGSERWVGPVAVWITGISSDAGCYAILCWAGVARLLEASNSRNGDCWGTFSNVSKVQVK